MDANKGEAERCLREADKWLRQNRPVKALKFAKKSHALFPTQAAQQKIGEITDLLQQRQFAFNPSPSQNINSAPYRRRNAPSASSSHSNVNNNHSNASSQNQDFVEIDPNSLNNNNHSSSQSIFANIVSLDYWALLMETIFGECFGSIHRVLSPLLPLCLLQFNLRYRRKVWFLLFITILLLFTRFVIVGHPFGSQVNTQYKPYRVDRDHHNVNIPYDENESQHKSHFEREKEKFERKYNKNRRHQDKKGRKEKKKQHNDRYYDDDAHYSGYSRSHGRYPRNDRHHRYGTNSSYSSWSLSPYNLMWLFVVGSMLLGMFGNRNNNGENNGINWNVMAFLPMLFGGFPMGGFYGRFGGPRRGMFGRRRRRFFF